MRKNVLIISALFVTYAAFRTWDLHQGPREPTHTPAELTDLALVKVDGLIGYINRSGTMIIKPQFQQGNDFSEGLAAVGMGVHSPFATDPVRMGYVDVTGKMVIEPAYDFTYNFTEGLAAVHTGTKRGEAGLWGFIDRTGRMVIEPQYLNVTEFSNGVAAVNEADDDWFLIDKSGKRISAQRRSTISRIVDGFALAQDSHTGPDILASLSGGTLGTYIIGADGNRVGPPEVASALLGFTNSDGTHLVSHLFPIYIHGLWGYMDRTGEIAIKPQFRSAQPFSEGAAWVVTTSATTEYIDERGAVMCVSPKLTPVPPGEEGNHWRDGSGPFVHGVAKLTYGTSVGFIDKKCDIVVQPKFDDAVSFSEDLVAVAATPAKPNGLGTQPYSFINGQGEVAFSGKFKHVEPLEDGLAVANDGLGFGYIDQKGKWIISALYDAAHHFVTTSDRHY